MRRALAVLAVLYGALVLGLQLPGTVALGAHEALHCYLEGGGACTTTWSPARTAETSADWTRAVPHVLVYVIGHGAGYSLLLPWLAGLNLVQRRRR